MERTKEPTRADREWATRTLKKLIIKSKPATKNGGALKLLLLERGRYENDR